MNDPRHLFPGDWIGARGGLWFVVDDTDYRGAVGRLIKACSVERNPNGEVSLEAQPGTLVFVPATSGEAEYLRPREIERTWSAAEVVAAFVRVLLPAGGGAIYWRPW